MKYDLIVSDPPWIFNDKLTMSDVKRGAESQYDTLNDKAIVDLDVKSIAADDSVLVLWVPSSKLQTGLDTMKSWGFEQTQTFIWVKTKKPGNWFADLQKAFKETIKGIKSPKDAAKAINDLLGTTDFLEEVDYNTVLNFYMGRLFRQTHEIALVGKRGKPYGALANKSQRSVLLDINLKHSAKPEELQDRLDKMFPDARKLEMFARRTRPNWECVGFECPTSLNEDIRDAIIRLKAI